jgi:hypothetical protein
LGGRPAYRKGERSVHRTETGLSWTGSVLLALASAWVIWFEFPRVYPEHGLWDFGSFVASARAAREGLSPYGIYPLTLHVSLPGFESWNPNLNPPISALLFRAFDTADPAVTFRVWQWISAALYAVTVALLLRRYGGRDWPAVAIWAFGLAGFWDTLFLGQIYIPLLLAAVGAWLLLERGRTVAAGVLIGILIAMKPNFLVWPALLFLAGHYRAPLVAGATAAAISAIPLAVYGFEPYLEWATLIASDRDRAFFLTNASLAGLAARAGVPWLGMVLGGALLLALAAWAFWKKPDPLRASAFALLASLLASPLGWIHYTLFLLPVLVSQWHRPVMRIVAALLLVPVPFIIGQFEKGPVAHLTVGSIYAWALVICLGALVLDETRRRPKESLEPGMR